MVTRPERTASAGTSPACCTGPRTDAGKARSCMNAVTHGLTAKTPLLPGEDPEAFRDFAWAMILDLEPEGPAQTELASRAAALMWKRRRINEAERQVMEELTAQYSEEPEEEERQQQEAGEQDAAAAADDPSGIARRILADEFASKPDQLERLGRYEQRISQQIDSTIRLLLRLQNRKDWKRRQDEAASEGEQPRPAAPPGAPARAPEGALAPPPAPAQNELAPVSPSAPKTAPGGAWTGPPGVN